MTSFTSEDLGGLEVKIGHKALVYLSRMCRPLLGEDQILRVILSSFRQTVGVSFSKVEPALVEAGLLIKLPGKRFAPGYSGPYKISDRGLEIAKGNTLKRMPRSHLEKLFVKAKQKIEEVQIDDRFLYKFMFVAVIGSYLQNKPDYGDLDLAYYLTLKDQFTGWSNRDLNAYHLDQWPGDRKFWLPWLMVAKNRPRRHVKSVSPQRIDTVTFDDFSMLQMRHDWQMPYLLVLGDLSKVKKAWLAEYDRIGDWIMLV